ncbi:IS66 family transposase [Thiolapillus sp.]|uniref:IS66 family transposase n=1 Tax=Thiolapillus sp. TaxID=2017437 RepID=UPI003AF69833
MFSLWRKARRENSAASRLLGTTSLRFALHGWQRKKHEMAVLLFARLSHVPFTNNRAERDLRMSKVKQKVSGCFRTRKHAEAYCRISSYLQIMANQGYNPLVAIQMAFSGQLYADRGE